MEWLLEFARGMGLNPNELIDVKDFVKLGLRLLFDLFFTSFIVLFVYIRKHGKTEYVFTFFLFNLITFSVCFLLRKIEIELGFALGLFAVFGILRYRTEPIRTRDLTYMFVVIGLAILNALVSKKVSLAEVLLVNSSIAVVIAGLEYAPFLKRDRSRKIVYDNMELVRGNDHEALMVDLRARTGLAITRVTVDEFDLLRDVAIVTVYSPNP